jgi:hypothetical protein
MTLKRSCLLLLAAMAASAISGNAGRLWQAEAGAAQAKTPVATQGTDWTVAVATDGTLRVYHKGSQVIEAKNYYWGAKWQWGNADFKRLPRNGEQYGVVGEVPVLKLKSRGKIGFSSPNTVDLVFQFNAAEEIPEAIGGGWQWDFKLDSTSFQGRLPDPELLADKTGWTWKTGNGHAITLRFDEPIADVYFEMNRKETIRTFFFKGNVPAGSHLFHAALQLPEGASRVPSIDERYGNADTRRWFRNALDWNSSPVDLSFLNRHDRPAGRHGFVRADGDRLVYEDGTPARFWGANLAAYALFATPRQNVAAQARRMAKLGYNLMRIHHHDSDWVDPNVFDRKFKDSRHLNAKSLDSLDWWIKCLKDEGIYIWLDLEVARMLMPGDPIGLGADEIKRGGNKLLGFCYYNEDLQKLMIEFQHNYLNHLNKYTKLRYRDDPALMAVLIVNESDLATHHGNLLLPDKNNPAHNTLFTRLYKGFARQYGLPESRVFQTWLPGPSKLFLSDREHEFNQLMIQDLKAMGVHAPIATTSYWGFDPLFSVPSLTDGDVIDVHSYGGSEALSGNPRYEANYLAWITAAQVSGKPLTITEWNVEYPNVDRFTAPLYLASIAALQGWDAPMVYNYSQDPLQSAQAYNSWSTFADPAMTGVMPAAALAFRRGHISPARKSYCLMLNPTQLFDRDLSPNTSATIRTLTEQSKLTIGMPSVKELPWLKASAPAPDTTVVTDPDRDFIPEGQSFVRSDTGELLRNWEFGIERIDTPKTQAVSGWIEGKTLKTQDATFRFENKKAVVALSSLDDRPLGTSNYILITAMARAIAQDNHVPYLSEPVTGWITLRTKTTGLQLLALRPDGSVVDRIVPARTDEAVAIQIPAGRGTHWYMLMPSTLSNDVKKK